ncbi:hypothetical protein CRM22_010792 [Opisthorchis felineus]|uniref:Uncharacterized protein n=1 Tax=Opisthorchis felineus TaxID=147828 RepID=A0A4S2KL87_OPIFE|nr:hypothetical protein CRM22_010792 [Opisthorchis felineus]
MTPLILLGFSFCFCATNVGGSVEVVSNPGCDAECVRLNGRPDIMYIRSADHNSSVHFLLLATGNVTPSLLAMHSSSPTAHVSINWNSLASSPSKVEQVIHLEQVTQSYGLVFLSFVDFNLTTKDGLRSSPTVDRSPNSFRPHYFDKGTWRLTESPVGNSGRISATYQASLAFHTYNGSVQIKVLLRDDRKSLDLEVTLDNFKTEYAHGQFGLEVVLSSNMSVVPGDDYMLTEKAVGDSRQVRTVYLGRRSNAAVDDVSQPAGYFQSTCHASTASCEPTLDIWRYNLTKSQNRRLGGTLVRYFYGERMHQQYAGLGSMTLVMERWSLANKMLPPIGLRLQRITFHQSSSHEVWRGSFGFTTELPQGTTLTIRPNPVSNQPPTINPERWLSTSSAVHHSDSSFLSQSLLVLTGLAVLGLLTFALLTVLFATAYRRFLCGEKAVVFIPLRTTLDNVPASKV